MALDHETYNMKRETYNMKHRSWIMDHFRVHDSRFRIHDRGFTLIEVIMVLGIFTIATTAAMSIFVSANKASRRTLALARVGTDARWVMEKMVEDIRLGTVEYGSTAIQNPIERLRLRTVEGELLEYGLEQDAAICGEGVTRCLAFARGNVAATTMTPKNMEVRRLDFYVWPITNPFIESATVRGQPRVTIVMETATTGGKKEEQSTLALQTTVSTRVYKR